MKALFINCKYIKLSMSMALSFGTGIAILTIIQQMLTDIGFKNASYIVSFSASSGIILGILATISYSYFIKKTKKYNLSLNIGNFLFI